MKVLEKGRVQKGWAKEYRCTGAGNMNGGCEALLLVEQDDVFKTYCHSRDETDIFHTFRCPECGTWTDIPSAPFNPREKDATIDGLASGGPRVDPDWVRP